MFDNVKVNVNERELTALAGTEGVRDSLQAIGDRVAAEASRNAPRRSGAGAASIHAVAVKAGGVWEVHISWSKANFYMYFHEFGTRSIRPRPFLRPALNRRYTV